MNAAPLITLTTDFGEDSPYVAAMKGVVLAINPEARLLDLTHQIPPQDVRHAAFFLAASMPYFPPGVLHVVVVDPGVGSARALLYVEAAGHRLLAPDNGCWTPLADRLGARPQVRRLEQPRLWRQPVSATFHGRDILAPVAAHLSLGLDPAELGPAVTDWVRLDVPAPVRTADGWAGEVVFVDHFGNLLTNVPGDGLPPRPCVAVGGKPVARWVRTYADAEPGTLVGLVSSGGTVEVAVVQGSAAVELGAKVGARVTVTVAEGLPPRP